MYPPKKATDQQDAGRNQLPTLSPRLFTETSMPLKLDSTIAAIATPPGLGGIGIIRISGPAALTILKKIFIPKNHSCAFISHRLYYGWIKEPKTRRNLDEVLAVYMQAPHTYTRDEVAEIHAHGSFAALQQIMALVINSGARLAEPGEFTKNAFLNGRLDLTQAEAIIDLLRAKTSQGLSAAVAQLRGGIEEEIKQITEQLTTMKAMVEVAIDFPDEEAEILNADALRRQIEPALKALEDLISAADHGRIIKDGISAVIIGRPNVGKSSLLNALLREDRAIVTSVPGTTRDTVEEYLDILGLPVHIVDTAGIRQARGKVEEIGIQRSMAKLATADLVIMLLDASSPPHADDERLFAETAGKPLIIVINKTDIKRPEIIREHYARFPDTAIVAVSAKTGDCLPQLEGLIYKTITGANYSAEPRPAIPNLRHQAAMTKALRAGRSFLQGLNNELAPDLMAIDLQTALDYLGEIVGYTTTEDILDKIFGDFCLGK